MNVHVVLTVLAVPPASPRPVFHTPVLHQTLLPLPPPHTHTHTQKSSLGEPLRTAPLAQHCGTWLQLSKSKSFEGGFSLKLLSAEGVFSTKGAVRFAANSPFASACNEVCSVLKLFPHGHDLGAQHVGQAKTQSFLMDIILNLPQHVSETTENTMRDLTLSHCYEE